MIVDEYGNIVQDVIVGVDGSVKVIVFVLVEEEKGGYDDSKLVVENQV